MTKLVSAFALCLLAITVSLAQDKPSPLEQGKSLKELMPRIKATETKNALKTFQVERGFKLELVAGEPLVGDPVDACFDEFGRMYVAEFHGYPYSAEPTKLHPKGGGKKNDGIIRLLEDADGDGKYEKSTVFVDNFEWALSVCCYDGGVFVIGHPHLWYFKDTDDDGKADVRKIVLTGFGKDNVQALANNMKWGLENRILVAGGRNPNTLNRDGKPVMSGTSDFSFDPRVMISDATADEVAKSIQLLSGGEQFGHSTDDWGNRFVCNNSNHIEHTAAERKGRCRLLHVRDGSDDLSRRSVPGGISWQRLHRRRRRELNSSQDSDSSRSQLRRQTSGREHRVCVFD
ncbi:MAG: membrane-bound dehydrogenase [Planctomycetota bacterium]|nr:MAG: membrane-bound dehydrogenase [Planctomycetota bacterium]